MKDNFQYIFWYVVGLTVFGAGLSVYSIVLDKSNIPNVLTFWLSMGVATGIGYLVGNSAEKNKKPAEGTATIDISATTETKES